MCSLPFTWATLYYVFGQKSNPKRENFLLQLIFDMITTWIFANRKALQGDFDLQIIKEVKWFFKGHFLVLNMAECILSNGNAMHILNLNVKIKTTKKVESLQPTVIFYVSLISSVNSKIARFIPTSLPPLPIILNI